MSKLDFVLFHEVTILVFVLAYLPSIVVLSQGTRTCPSHIASSLFPMDVYHSSRLKFIDIYVPIEDDHYDHHHPSYIYTYIYAIMNIHKQ